MTSPQYTPDVPYAPAVRRGMRGGLQRVAAAAQAATLDAARGAGQVATRAAAARYWSGAWAVAAALVAVLVVRVTEIYPRLALVRPAILTTGVALLLTAAFTPASARRALVRDPQFRRVLAYVGLAAAMVPLALWRGRSFSMVQTMAIFDVVLVGAVLLCAPTARTLERLLLTYVLATSAYALAVTSSGVRVEGDRLSTIGSYDPNDLAALLCTALPMACALVVRRGAGWLRPVGLACAAILCYTVTLTGSRGGLIAMVAGAAVLVAGFNPARLVPAAIALVMAAPVVWSSAPETFRVRARSIFALEQDYNTQSTGGRQYIWKRGLVFFARSPVVGVGPGNFDTRLGRDFEAQGTVGAWHTAHNTPIQVLVELGIVGGALYALMFAAAFRAAARVYRVGRVPAAAAPLHYPELMAAFVSFCTSAMFLSHAYSHFAFFLVALGGYAARVFDQELGPKAGAARSRG
jgi:O-antigen ligase